MIGPWVSLECEKDPAAVSFQFARAPAIAAAVSNISSRIYRETASIFTFEHNALFELSLKCCAHDSLARPGKCACVCLALALPRARAHMQQRLLCRCGGDHHLFKFGPKKAWFLGRVRVRADKVHADTDIVPLLLVFISIFFIVRAQV